MKKHFILTFAFLLVLGLGSSVALAQVEETESPDPVVAETAVPTETPTPSDSPELIVAVEQPNTIDPVWVFLAGALIGAALLSISEVTAVTYQKKQGKGSKK